MNDGPGWPVLDDCETLIETGEELQWRQINPQHLDSDLNGAHITPLAFQDSTRRVSTSRSSLISAAQAYDYHVNVAQRASAGTWAVSVDEIKAASCRAIDDRACDGVETPAHSYIDMRGLDRTQRRVARVELATRATVRGRHHPPAK
jgi:hypothetical protein